MLEKLGFTTYESRVMELLLKESLDAKQISSRANVPFGKIYTILGRLKQKGLIRDSNTRPNIWKVQNASEAVSSIISERESEDKLIFSRLRKIASTIDRSKTRPTPFFQIGTTNEENREIQLRTFQEARKEVLQILNIHHKPDSNRKNKDIWENAIASAMKRGVNFRCIYPPGKAPRPILEFAQTEKFSVRYYATDFARCDIIDGKKVLIKLIYTDPLQFGGVLFIEDERLAQNLRSIFETFWTAGKPE